MTNKKPNSTAVTVITEERITASIDIDKDDLIAVGVTEAEEYMQAELAAAEEAVDAFRKEANQACVQHQDLLNDMTEQIGKELKPEILEGLKCLGVKKITVDSSHQGVQYRAVKKGDKEVPYFTVTLAVRESVQNGGKRHGNVVHFNKDLEQKVPKEVLDLIEQQKQAEANADQKREEALSWKRRLAGMPQYERKLRAELAKHRLSQSQEGRDIINTMLSDVKKRVLGLPGKRS